MFAKLLKYDFRSVARVWWIMAPVVLGSSAAGSVALRIALSLTSYDHMALVVLMGVLCFFGCIFTLAASALVTELLIYWRFYKHFYTDEGYLTFTLPVSRKKLLFVKTLNAIIWYLLEGLLIMTCVLFFVIISPPTFDGSLLNLDVWRDMGQMFALIWQTIGAWIFIYAILWILLCVVLELLGIFLVHFCITVGAVIAKKAKLLAAIGIYYGVTMILSFVGQIAVWFLTLILGGGLLNLMTTSSEFLIHSGIILFILLAICVMTTVATVLYCATLNLLERKLNLA
jgi:hypothetical protein